MPRLKAAGNVSFIFDTGADTTVLMPAESATLGVDYGELKNPFVSHGIGGPAPNYIERAHIMFVSNDMTQIYGFNVQLLIHHPSPDAMRVPSLLGRDVIDRLRVTYDKSTNELLATVVSCDISVGPLTFNDAK